ncbi:MAG: hypothetical protein HRT88_14155 [Lentisphaeraceae bacterium]|nr:hypothetical protein [Lentisphaeraceae bacterium]
MILYFCPDLEVKSSGIRRLYKHVAILTEAGIDAAILHNNANFIRTDLATVPIKSLDTKGCVNSGDIIVIPEGFPGLMKSLKDAPVRRIVICLSWSYVFTSLEDKSSWRDYNIERILGASEFTTDIISWSMGLPGHTITSSLNDKLYFQDLSLSQKKKKIVYIKRKSTLAPLLKKVLYARNPAFIDEFEWLPLEGLDEEEFAQHVREAAIFLNLSEAEALANACFEAMRSNTLLCGFSSIGGQNSFIGDGEDQNAIITETGDYLSLAWMMEPLLNDILNGELDKWQSIVDRAYEDTLHMTAKREKEELLSFWKRMLRQKSI